MLLLSASATRLLLFKICRKDPISQILIFLVSKSSKNHVSKLPRCVRAFQSLISERITAVHVAIFFTRRMIPTSVSFAADSRPRFRFPKRNATHAHTDAPFERSVCERVSAREDRLSQTSASVARETGRKATRNKGVESRGAARLLFFRPARIQVSGTRVTGMLEHYFKDVIKIARRYTRLISSRG